MKKNILSVILTTVLSVFIGVAIVLLDRILPPWLYWSLLIALVLVYALYLVFLLKKKESLTKLTFTVVAVAALIAAGLLVLYYTGVIDKFYVDGKFSGDALRDYIESTGHMGKIIFVLAQFLQVTFIPIPSTVVTLTGVALFERWTAFFLSVTGQILGSMLAFFLGKVFGVKLVKWIIGEDTLTKYQTIIRGKDKAVLVFMFLFPFFPDDVLCLIAGLTAFNYPGFFLLMCITRPLTTVVTVLIGDGALNIPFQGTGLIIWALIIVATVAVLILMMKYGDKIESWLLSLFNRKRRSTETDHDSVE